MSEKQDKQPARDPEDGLTDEELLARAIPTRDEAATLIQDRLGPDSRFADWLTTGEITLIELIRRATDDPERQRKHAEVVAEHFAAMAAFGVPKRG